jgi:hypothetical protein
MVIGVSFPGGYRGSDNWSPSSTEFKNDGAISSLPCMSSWHDAYLIKHRENFAFTLPNFNWIKCLALFYRAAISTIFKCK